MWYCYNSLKHIFYVLLSFSHGWLIDYHVSRGTEETIFLRSLNSFLMSFLWFVLRSPSVFFCLPYKQPSLEDFSPHSKGSWNPIVLMMAHTAMSSSLHLYPRPHPWAPQLLCMCARTSIIGFVKKFNRHCMLIAISKTIQRHKGIVIISSSPFQFHCPEKGMLTG